MKNLARKSLTAVGLMISLTVLANNPAKPFKEKERKATHLQFENVKEGSTLAIKDLNGLTLYKESIEKSGDYDKKFDLTSLPDGDYFFELNSELKMVVLSFNVKSSEVILDENGKDSIFKPVIRKKGQMVYVWKTSLDQAPLSCTIYFADNNDLVLSEEFGKMEEVRKVYDFSSSKKGAYIFVFESKGKKYSKTIKI